MSQVIRQETIVFLTAVLHGAVLTLFYDLFRALRRVFPHSLAAVSAEDFLFWIAAGFLTFCLLFLETDGVIRGYVAVGAALGVIIYLNVFSRPVLWIVTHILGGIRAAARMIGKVQRAVCRILGKAVRNVWRAVCRILGKAVRNVWRAVCRILGKAAGNVWRIVCRIWRRTGGKMLRKIRMALQKAIRSASRMSAAVTQRGRKPTKKKTGKDSCVS